MNRSEMHNKRTWHRIITGVLLLAVTCLAPSCTNTIDNTDTETAPRPELSYRFRWSADETIDLQSREAELVRAAVEATDMALFFGADRSFPGYSEAIDGPRDSVDGFLDHIGVRSSQFGKNPPPMSRFNHIVNFKVTGNRISANVCDYVLHPNGDNNGIRSLSTSGHVVLELPPGGSRGLPGIPDLNPDDAKITTRTIPDWNVFGDWEIRKYAAYPVNDRTIIPVSCLAWWQEQFPEFERKSELNILNAPKGWTPPTIPLVAQYPEWIGPSKPE